MDIIPYLQEYPCISRIPGTIEFQTIPTEGCVLSDYYGILPIKFPEECLVPASVLTLQKKPIFCPFWS